MRKGLLRRDGDLIDVDAVAVAGSIAADAQQRVGRAGEGCGDVGVDEVVVGEVGSRGVVGQGGPTGAAVGGEFDEEVFRAEAVD